jgi:hypothetical protein
MAASALQYVRKVSGMSKPSQANVEAFERAVAEVTAITRRLLLEELVTSAAPRDRSVEAERARIRGQAREERLLARLRSEMDEV